MNSELVAQQQHYIQQQPDYNSHRFNMADQFQPHTPSFGDEELFDMSSLGLMGGVPPMAEQQHHVQQPMYQAEMQHYAPLSYNPMADAAGYTLQTLGSSANNNNMAGNRYSPQRITVECRPADVEHRTISATTMAPPNWTGPGLMPGVNTSPLNATPPSGDTSEESGDDCHPHLAQLTQNKRPSPEPLDSGAGRGAVTVGAQAPKKAKVTAAKKKKRRDPHEPQKPVSAYALFFRDTQAAIKGQNPNASFGEVSKIVASMWDALDADSKNVYKKKTEAAKKEYLKALAAYRASVVSKEGNNTPSSEQGMFQPGNSQQQNASTQGFANYQGSYSMAPQVQQAPPAPQYTTASPANQPPVSPMSKKQPSPLLNSLMVEQQQQQQQHQLHLHQQQQLQQHQQQQNMMNYQLNRPYMNQPQQMMQNSSPLQGSMNYPPHVMQQQQQQQQQQQPNQRVMAMGKPGGNNVHQHCIRSGCPNAAIPSPDWENEYCSNECVVSHCRDVFSAWVAAGQGAPPGYPPPVK